MLSLAEHSSLRPQNNNTFAHSHSVLEDCRPPSLWALPSAMRRRPTKSRDETVDSGRHGEFFLFSCAYRDGYTMSWIDMAQEGPPKSMTHTFQAIPSISHASSAPPPTIPSSSTISFRVSDRVTVGDSVDAAVASSYTEPRLDRSGKQRDASYIPRPPNAFILFRSSFIRNHPVPDSVEANHSNLSKIAGKDPTPDETILDY